MFLANPAAYLSVASFKAQPNDIDLTPYTDAQLQDLLVRASSKADSIMRRSLQGQERTLRIDGDGTNRLELRAPVLYIKKVQIVVPGTTGPLIPIDQLLIDYVSGGVLEYTPFYYNGQGYFSRFPYGIPVDFTLATGYTGFSASAPSFTTVDDNSSTALPAGTYNLAITTKTMYGETTAVVQQYTTASGVFTSTINPVLGAYLYRAYVSSAANNTTLSSSVSAGASTFPVVSAGSIKAGDVLLVGSGSTAEYATVGSISGTTVTPQSALANAHNSGERVIEQPVLVGESPFTAYGSTAMTITVDSLQAPTSVYQDVLPLTDTAAPVLPTAIVEAVRLMALSMLYEQNNLANRGVYMTESGRKRVSWISTEGRSGKGVPLLEEQARELLKPYSLQAIF